MLLKFYTQNYRSFRNGFVFSMEPAPKQKGLDYSILSEKIGGKPCKALSAAVIYGPNASGKTNIIGAMDTMRSIVLRGHIRDADEANCPNMASCKLFLIPFSGAPSEPVQMGVVFVHREVLVEYSFVMDLGEFLERDYKRRIVAENLSINRKKVFSRNEGTLSLDGILNIQSFLNDPTILTNTNLKKVAESGMLPTELFLTNGFKSIYSKKLSELIAEWFSERFMVIYQANAMQLVRRFRDSKENTIYVENTLNDAAKAFGINSNALGFRQKGEDDAVLCSLFEKDGGGVAMPAEFFESYGTVRFINEFPLVIRALATGSVLVVDEFDASIHPMALMNLINIFHNDEINIHHAQLIFNTHNPIFLNANLYRRDEIKFVERDAATHISAHYSLSDFKTAGERGVRKGEDYMKNYFINRYGAIKDIDFSPLLEKIITSTDEEAVPHG